MQLPPSSQNNPFAPSQTLPPISSNSGNLPEFESAKLKLKGPGIAMLVTGIIGFIGMGGYLILNIISISMGMGDIPDPDTMKPEERTGFYIGFYGVHAVMGLGVLAQIPIAMAGYAMLKVKSKGLAFLGSVLAVIPCISSCCILGLPFGIWALVILNQPDVSNAFRANQAN